MLRQQQFHGVSNNAGAALRLNPVGGHKDSLCLIDVFQQRFPDLLTDSQSSLFSLW
ncbi:hypothetical protein [Fuerstiella marisgermanici]|uniref:Uncharacterized protein n=1 Tax=Fuerstiella marisgermanici TaxID=1891926 RepID=A0A1P8WGP2_9PLAN|nr:hypothetical protein [Fuerstiella marisgermanici]APZ93241.1 hypothetical protein Fuma_02858 [Fuerstiella marisgermanici]